MNSKAIFGFLVTAALLVWGILLGGPFYVFFDVGSGVIVVGVTGGLLVVTHGLKPTLTSLLGGLGRLLVPRRFMPWTPQEAESAAQIASSAIRYAMLAAVLGGLIAFIAMLQSLDDPTEIGPAVAVMLLCSFYALMLIALWFLPVSRRFS